MPFIKSKSLGAPGSSGGAIVRGPPGDSAIRTRFFGLRLVDEVSSECRMRDKSCRQQKRLSADTVIACVKLNGRIAFERCKIDQLRCTFRASKLIHGTGGYQYVRRSALVQGRYYLRAAR